MIKKLLALGYGIISYTLFASVFGYAILFIGNVFVTPSLDSPGSNNLILALLINAGLLGIFALQHSIMARPAFKRVFTKLVPEPVERSTYVLVSSVLLASIVHFWQPMGGVIWQISDPTAVSIIYSLFTLGWCILLLATLQINHFDLFGIRQVWLYFRGKPYTQLPFKTPWLYRHVRHPLYVGMMIGMWAAPTMTVAHLLFAILSTGYIFIGARLEERDLEKILPEYRLYKKQIPMFLPTISAKREAGVQAESV